tara:strand:+ start:6117 stop:7103 length:987 start_codon:yes stop_codon:yes gene_type:complete
MQAFLISELGSPGASALGETALPVPRDEDVRIRVDATGLGFVDGLIIQGRYQIRPPVPYIPGCEIVGIVDAVGAAVNTFSIGDRVATWQMGGGLAEYALANADEIDSVPLDLPARDAAALLLDFQTAHYALFGRGSLQAGETVLVLGASGGVGLAAVQLAKNASARVIAAASTDAKRRTCMDFGAHAIIDSGNDLRAQLKELAPDGIDVVVDTVGGTAFEPAFRSLAKNGRHLVIGFASGQIPSLAANLALLKSAALIGVDIRHFRNSQPQNAQQALAQIFNDAATGRIRPPVIQQFDLAHSADALAATTLRDKAGKIVVTVNQHAIT